MLSVKNHTYQVAREAEAIAVHFPGPGDHDFGELFGSLSGDEIDKFEHCEWTKGPYGLPLLSRCPNRFVAPIVEVTDFGGDHVCFFVEPETTEFAAPVEQLRFQAVRDLRAGHEP
jgi:flavin reductase (DIM6/NTAB) family NADH-FMN oxidoreductase RutF